MNHSNAPLKMIEEVSDRLDDYLESDRESKMCKLTKAITKLHYYLKEEKNDIQPEMSLNVVKKENS